MLIKKAFKPVTESQDPTSVNEDDTEAVLAAESISQRLSSASTALKEIQDLVVESEKEGGLPPLAAHAVGIALEHIFTSFGLTPPVLDVSLEDFNENGRKDATTLVLESVKETIEVINNLDREFFLLVNPNESVS